MRARGGGGKSEDLIVGARLQAWSAAVGKTVAGSGLRGLPGLYLVSVKREDTLIRAVGPEFVLSQGDVLYFTGMVESIGNVCAEYGLLAVTTEHDSDGEGGFDDDGSDGDENDDSPPAGRVSPEGAGRGAEEGADESALAPMELGSTTETESDDGSATKVQTTKARATNVGIPPSVPETSALMEIQMLARSRAIGGVAGEWQSAGPGASRRRRAGGKVQGRRAPAAREPPRRGLRVGVGGRRGWSSGGELGRRSDFGGSAGAAASTASGGMKADSRLTPRPTPRPASRAGAAERRRHGSARDPEIRRERGLGPGRRRRPGHGEGVALDPGERGSLRMRPRRHPEGTGGEVDRRSVREARQAPPRLGGVVVRRVARAAARRRVRRGRR